MQPEFGITEETRANAWWMIMLGTYEVAARLQETDAWK